VFLFAVSIAAFSFFIISRDDTEPTDDKNLSTTIEKEEENEIIESKYSDITVFIKQDCENVENNTDVIEGIAYKTFCVEYVSDNAEQTAFDALYSLDKSEEDFSFSYDESDFGAFITSIDGYTPNSDKEFWAFYVNDDMSNVGISDHTCEIDDKLHFFLDEVEF